MVAGTGDYKVDNTRTMENECIFVTENNELLLFWWVIFAFKVVMIIGGIGSTGLGSVWMLYVFMHILYLINWWQYGITFKIQTLYKYTMLHCLPHESAAV